MAAIHPFIKPAFESDSHYVVIALVCAHSKPCNQRSDLPDFQVPEETLLTRMMQTLGAIPDIDKRLCAGSGNSDAPKR
jgi:hypothetical protein